MTPGGGGVVRRDYGRVGSTLDASFDPFTWPSGQMFNDILRAEKELQMKAAAATTETIELGKLHYLRQTQSEEFDAKYWQAAARFALMTKYDVLLNTTNSIDRQIIESIQYKPTSASASASAFASSVDECEWKLALSEDAVRIIARRWKEIVDVAIHWKDDNDEPTSSNDKGAVSAPDESALPMSKDLFEFLRTGRSNHRWLQWTVLECSAGLQFPLHAHPNLELVLCFRGALHEIRMTGDALKMPSTTQNENSDINSNINRTFPGPNLSKMRRAWQYCVLQSGEFLVNEVGSVHKSFTTSIGGPHENDNNNSNNNNGCALLVLWGGSHADIDASQEPHSPNVHKAVDQMDAQVSSMWRCGCDKGTFMTDLSKENFFLPDPPEQ